jgi:hypothetical protein
MNFGNIQGRISQPAAYLSTNQRHQLMLSFADLRQMLLNGDSITSIRESSPSPDEGMKNRMSHEQATQRNQRLGNIMQLATFRTNKS